MLIENYVNTGLITFEFRDFPILGPESYSAAEAAWCALDQDMYWEYHDTIFANHQGENQGGYSDDRLKEMAEVIGLDQDAFNECYDSGTHEDDVLDSYNEGAGLGVNSTPTLMINGELMQYQGVSALAEALDAALAEQE